MSKPLGVLLVDDHGENGEPGMSDGGSSASLAALLRAKGVDAEALAPPDVEDAHLESRDLILVDFRITEEWTPEAAPLVQTPRDGLAVAAVLRSHLGQGPPVGVALYSAKLEDLAGGMAVGRREHVVARLHGLEWAFSKLPPPGLPGTPERVISLAAAVRDLGAVDPDAADWEDRLLGDVLRLPVGTAWSDGARRQLEVAQLPRDELIAASGGLVALRWLAHRVLPYPGVLVGCSHVAAILGVDPSLLIGDEARGGALGRALDPYRYRGALCDLLGPRWWRVGIEHQVATWEPSEMAVATDSTLAEIAELSGEKPQSALGSVACVDADFEPTGELAPKLDCVRLRPDDWPVFATPAWMRIDDVLEQELEHFVDPADLDLLQR